MRLERLQKIDDALMSRLTYHADVKAFEKEIKKLEKGAGVKKKGNADEFAALMGGTKPKKRRR